MNQEAGIGDYDFGVGGWVTERNSITAEIVFIGALAGRRGHFRFQISLITGHSSSWLPVLTVNVRRFCHIPGLPVVKH